MITVILSRQDLADLFDDDYHLMLMYTSELRQQISNYYNTQNVDVSFSPYQLVDKFDIDGEPDDGTIAELMNRMVSDWSWLE